MANFRNLAYGIVRTAPSPGTSGTSLVLEAGHGARFPNTALGSFQATVWPVTVMPDPTNAEIVTVTLVAGDTVTMVRHQEGTVARDIQPDDQIAATITKAYLDAVPLTTDPLVTFAGALTTEGLLTAASGLSVIGDASITGDVSVGDDVMIAGDTSVGGAATITGAATIGGATSIAGDLSVAGIVNTPQLRGYRETAQTVTLTGSTLVIDFAGGNHVLVSLTAAITAITITGLPAAGLVAPVLVWYTAVSGGHTVTHTINGHAVRFPAALAPVMSTVAGKIDRILYTTADGGTTWVGDIFGVNY